MDKTDRQNLDCFKLLLFKIKIPGVCSKVYGKKAFNTKSLLSNWDQTMALISEGNSEMGAHMKVTKNRYLICSRHLLRLTAVAPAQLF